MKSFDLSCPAPSAGWDRVLLAHGGGGRLSHQLIEKIFLPEFFNLPLGARHDGAVVEVAGVRLAMTTDSYVVRPLFFPGGSIGELAVYGTVNDLAMCGARPLYLSAGFILEEGCPMETLRRVAADMGRAARRVGVELVAGDTKVVDKGKGDLLYVNTAGIGRVETHLKISPASVAPGDAIVLSGDVGRHGIAVLSVREGLEFETPIESDAAPLWAPVRALLEAGLEIHCLRDLTRGGLASALNEIAATRGVVMRVREAAVPVSEGVKAACEVLGLDPLYVANEGRFVVFVPEPEADQVLRLLRAFPGSERASLIGRVEEGAGGQVLLESRIGGARVLDMLSGEQLPRIC